MAFTTIITRDVENRYRGFLTSVMLEVAPGVYVSADLSAGVRERVWTVMKDWWAALQRGSIVMIYPRNGVPGNVRIETLGEPPKEIVEADGILLLKRR